MSICGRCSGGNHSRHSEHLGGGCQPPCRCPDDPLGVGRVTAEPAPVAEPPVDGELVEERELSPDLREQVRATIAAALEEARATGTSLEQGVELATSRLEPVLRSVDENARQAGASHV